MRGSLIDEFINQFLPGYKAYNNVLNNNILFYGSSVFGQRVVKLNFVGQRQHDVEGNP